MILHFLAFLKTYTLLSGIFFGFEIQKIVNLGSHLKHIICSFQKIIGTLKLKLFLNLQVPSFYCKEQFTKKIEIKIKK